jgi:hypothetical protein
MAHSDNILSFTGHKIAGRNINLNSGERKAVDNCRQVVAWMMPQLIEGMFDKLDDALFDLSNKAESNDLQTLYFDAMRILRKEREALENGFQRRILGAFDEFWRLGDIPASREAHELETDAESLSLVGEEELEEKLATTNMISKGDSRYYRELYALEQRFSRLAHEVVVDSNNNPLSPATICRLFRDTIQPLELDLQVKLVVFKLFDKEVMQYLGGLYDGINDVLAQAGILPKLSQRVKNPVSPAVKKSSYKAQDRSEEEAASARELENEIDLELFPRLQELLNLRRGPAVGGQIQGQQVIDTAQVISALSNLQQGNFALLSFGPDGDIVVPEQSDLREYLLQQLNTGKEADANAISRTDENIIDVISMLFDFILEDHNLPDAMKALLARLQIPMVKVAIIDQTFFGRKSHPARLMLNNLAKAALGWTDDGDRSERSLYRKIESIVSRVLSDFDRDVVLFEELNQEFEEFLGKEQQASKVAEERAAQVTRGKEQLQIGKQEVEHEIEVRFRKTGTLPQAVVELIRDGWKDVLLLTALRSGLDSKEWQEGLAMMDQLIWSVAPKTSREEQRKLLDAIPVLLKGFRKELNEISFDQHKTARLFKDLQACHVVALRGNQVTGINPLPKEKQGESAEAAADTKNGATPSTPKAEPEAAGPAVDYLEKAKSLAIGDWIEYKRPKEDTLQRIKLAWKSVVTGNHLFVNRKGLKVMEVTVEQLAHAISSGTVILLEEAGKPLVDRAMKAVVNNLEGQTA